MRKISKSHIISIIIVLLLFSCNKINYYLYRANMALENTKTDKAEHWYKKALKKDSLHFRANCEYGLMLGEWMNLHEKALPYLENAYKKMPKDTNWNLMHGLAKSYQHQEKYREALDILNRMTDIKTWDSEDKNELLMDIEKRKSDCQWALAHSKEESTVFAVVNAGNKINTDKPEYVPLMASNGDLFFTSKRKDADREKFSLLDGKYHEAIYYTDPISGQINRYVIPENNRKKLSKNKYHESLVSLSNNKKVYFYFSKGQLYEVHADSLKTQTPRKLSKSVNFEYYHNHAFLTSDGKTLFFTSDADGGLGGLDIYMAEKQADGTWGKAINLGKEINTPFDEDAPFFDEKNQILYFSSKGHPGFGFYDVYAAQKQDGKFLPPVNMGKPINSGGHDIFYTLTPYDFALHSSSRKGGYGDMDIYKLWNTLGWEKRPCTNSSFPFSETKEDNHSLKIRINFPYQILKYEWISNVNIKEQNKNEIMIEIPEGFKEKITLSWKALSLSDTSRYLNVYCMNITPAMGEALATNSIVPLPKDESTDIEVDWKNLTPDAGINNSNVYFDFDSYRLNSEEKIKLEKIAGWITKNGYQIRIQAFADDRGSDNYNIELSQKRALAIKNFLIKNGVNASDIIEVVGKGKFPLKDTRYVEQRVGELKFRKKP